MANIAVLFKLGHDLLDGLVDVADERVELLAAVDGQRQERRQPLPELLPLPRLDGSLLFG